MRSLFTLIFICIGCYASAQNSAITNKGEIALFNPTPMLELKRGEVHSYSVDLKKDNRYVFSVLQRGIDVVVKLVDENEKQLAEKDSPNGKQGFEKLTYTVSTTGKYHLQIMALDDSTNSNSGQYQLYVAEQSPELVKKLAAENKKNVQTLDIDHFWEAYDNLKNCTTRRDSIRSFQRLYIDRATEGFEDFLAVRGFTASEYLATIKKNPKFYQSIRSNTLAAKKAEPLIQEVFDNFKALYPNFKPFKVNFAIGTLRTGGTISKNYVLIGAEISTANNKTDLSELINSPLGKVMARDASVEQIIKNIVAHESVHTQQAVQFDANAERCNLLTTVMLEGFCDFVGELIAGSQINQVALEYGNKHEKELWAEFSADPCDGKVSEWLYNFSTVKDGKPADLGYYMGYKIAESYYNLQADKKQAIVDIIELKDPKLFLEKSRYAEKFN